MVKRMALIAFGIAILVLGVAAVIFVLPKFGKSKSAQKAQESDGVSVGSLINSQKNQSCNYSFKLEAGEGVGVAYIGDGVMRNDLKFTYKSGNPYEEHIIVLEPVAYFWNSLTSNGTKSQVDLTKDSDKTTTQTGLDRKVLPKCSSWKVDPSKFVVPANLQFAQVSAGKPLPNIGPLVSTPAATAGSPIPGK